LKTTTHVLVKSNKVGHFITIFVDDLDSIYNITKTNTANTTATLTIAPTPIMASKPGVMLDTIPPSHIQPPTVTSFPSLPLRPTLSSLSPSMIPSFNVEYIIPGKKRKLVQTHVKGNL
jgi:hypothetical protein